MSLKKEGSQNLKNVIYSLLRYTMHENFKQIKYYIQCTKEYKEVQGARIHT